VEAAADGIGLKSDSPPATVIAHMATHHATAAGGGATVPRAYWTAWAATVVFFAGFYALLVPLPRYLAAAGLPDWQIGFVLGAFGVASLVGRPIAGVASDRFGSRRVMLVGAASLAVGALAVPATTSVALLFALRVLQATGYVAFTTAGTALVVSLVSPEERGRRLAVFGAAANVAISLTPAAISALLDIAPIAAGLFASGALASLGGLLALRLPSTAAPPLSPAISRTPLPAASRAALSVAAAGWVESSVRTSGESALPPDQPRPIVWAIPRRLWLPMLVSALLGAGFAAFFQFAPILTERRGTVSPGVLYTVYGAAIIATRMVGGRLLDRFDVSRVVALAAGLIAFGHALLAASSGPVSAAASSGLLVAVLAGPAPLLVAPVLIAAGSGLFHPALIAHHAALLPDAPGRASAAFYVAFDLGIGLGSWLFGFALQIAGLPGLYWTATVLVVAVLPLAPKLVRGNACVRA
jgi:predicted MFS family arabinose efflux permease